MTLPRDTPAPAAVESPWTPAPTRGPLHATVTLPGSKSLTARYLVLGALASAPLTVVGPQESRDARILRTALEHCGVSIQTSQDTHGTPAWTLQGPLGPPSSSLHCGLAGTAMRFLPAMLAHRDGPSRFEGDPHAAQRPLEPLLGALRSLGVRCETPVGASLPLTVWGVAGLRGGEVSLDSSASSQFMSALLLSGGECAEGLTVCHVSAQGRPVPSVPHLEMTVHTLRQLGVPARRLDETAWHVPPAQPRGGTIEVEPELSGAAAFVAAAAVAGGTVRIPRWPQHTTQAGDAILTFLQQMGARVHRSPEAVEVQGHQLRGIDACLRDYGELTPVLAALAACASTPSRLTGIAHIRGHETDRITALARELSACGAQVEELADGLAITPLNSPPPQPPLWHTYDDHRMVMAGAVISLRVPGLRIENPATVGKTMPQFTTWWDEMICEPVA